MCFKLLRVGITSYTAKITNIGVLVEETSEEIYRYTDILRNLRPRESHYFCYWYYMSWAGMDLPHRKPCCYAMLKQRHWDSPTTPKVPPLIDLLTYAEIPQLVISFP